jgi:hypothetical protein
LREQLIEWVTDYKDVASRNALAETPKESADYLLSLLLKEVEGARLTEEQTFNLGFKTSYRAESTELFAYSEGVQDGINAQLEAVKKILGKV